MLSTPCQTSKSFAIKASRKATMLLESIFYSPPANCQRKEKVNLNVLTNILIYHYCFIFRSTRWIFLCKVTYNRIQSKLDSHWKPLFCQLIETVWWNGEFSILTYAYIYKLTTSLRNIAKYYYSRVVQSSDFYVICRFYAIYINYEHRYK